MSFFEFPHTRTYDSDLGWLIKKVKYLLDCCDQMQEWKAEHEEQYNELKKLYDDVMSGSFPPSIVAAFEEWMFNNAIDLVGKLVKHVYFGLTNDGYFCAYIPENWSDIQFDSVTDFNDALYGHLMVIYD